MNTMTNITLSLIPTTDPVMESNVTDIDIRFPNNSLPEKDHLKWTVVSIFILLVSPFGMMGNGTIIWILGCCSKRNHFTTYILNLCIADFGVVMILAIYSICCFLSGLYRIDCPFNLKIVLFFLFLFTFSTSQFLLAVISIDRCICIFFPFWHKCHRPPYLSTILCVTIWILTFLISAFNVTFELSNTYFHVVNHQLFLNAVIFMPAMAISTIAMLIKVCFISPHHKRRKLLRAILLALLFFLFFAFPMNVTELFFIGHIPVSSYLDYYGPIGASLNSAINPVIYFLVGRCKKAQSRGKIKKMLEKLFQEEESCGEAVECAIETHL
uniref:Mas-related G-protein coupled receptor member H-like n=1 Tax=Pogona vitticeps TaxID=103695 RepID=A0A6J0SHP4_9SAUR